MYFTLRITQLTDAQQIRFQTTNQENIGKFIHTRNGDGPFANNFLFTAISKFNVAAIVTLKRGE